MKARWIALGAVALLGLAGALLLAPGALGPGKPESIRLGAYDGDVGALEWIAQDKGFFQKVGLQVTMKGYPSGNAAVDAMRAGEVDVAAAADLVVAKRSFDEPDLRILADICRYWNKGLVARKDRGIAVPADLRGKRIGVPATSSAEHNLVVFLALQGLSSEDVTIVDLPPKQLVDGMAAGTIDAGLIWQPHVAEIQRRLGDNAVTLMDGGTEAHLLLVTSEGYLPGGGAALTKLMQALLLAETWVNDNPEEAKAYLATRFKLDRDYIDLLWPRMQLGLSLPQEILVAMDSEARWLAKTNNRASLPDFTDTIHTAPLRAAKPAAVYVFTK